MIVGFFLDNRALHRIDLPFESLLLDFYFASAGLVILGIHLAEEGVWKGKWAAAFRPWLPIAFQFITGSWMSAYLVFYSRSASLGASWPFLLLVLAVFAGTEIFKKYSDRLVFQNALYFFAVFSYFTFTVPLWFKAIGTNVFLLSGAVSIGFFGAFYLVLFSAGPRRFADTARRVVRATLVIYLAMNALYFTHLIPPLPLALEDVGIYHSLVKTGTGYAVTAEPHDPVSSFFGYMTEEVRAGDSLFAFSAVFAPVALKTDIVHRWEYYDPPARAWITKNVVTFPVVGGRDGGYRGFSEVNALQAGRWRVSVETPSGQLIGRIEFNVVFVSALPPVTESVL